MLSGPWDNNDMKSQVLRNCCDKEIGLYILDCARNDPNQIDKYFSM